MDKVSTPGTGHGRKWSDIRRGFSPSRGMSDRTKKEGVGPSNDVTIWTSKIEHIILKRGGKKGGKKEKEHNNLFFDL